MSNDNVALAFALTIGAGLSTTLGSLAPFISKLQSREFLTASLATSAGVMLYVSFAEILDKSREYLEHDLSDSLASWYTTSSFFGGILFCWGLHKVVHEIEAFRSRGQDDSPRHTRVHSTTTSEHGSAITFEDNAVGTEHEHEMQQIGNQDEEAGTSEIHLHRHNSELDLSLATDSQMYRMEDARLKEMGMMTALTIGIHNFPEGLATFVATLAHPHLGIAMAVAVALHNIPEGVCVSLPIFYATRSYRSAFIWSFMSGISEPIGALVGWIALRNVFNNTVYGILFGFVSGMMVYVCVSELIPTAIRYDTENKGITAYMIGGMAIMALSVSLVTLPSE